MTPITTMEQQVKSGKAALRLERAMVRSDGRETRRVRRARWARLGHDKPPWEPSVRIPTIPYAAWMKLVEAGKKRENALKKNRFIQFITQAASAIVNRPYRHQAR